MYSGFVTAESRLMVPWMISDRRYATQFLEDNCRTSDSMIDYAIQIALPFQVALLYLLLTMLQTILGLFLMHWELMELNPLFGRVYSQQPRSSTRHPFISRQPPPSPLAIAPDSFTTASEMLLPLNRHPTCVVASRTLLASLLSPRTHTTIPESGISTQGPDGPWPHPPL